MNYKLNDKDLIYNNIPLKILSYLSKNRADDSIYGSKIAKDLNISQGGASTILKQMKDTGIIDCKTVGKTVFYSVGTNNPMIKSFRVFENLLELNNIFQSIKEISRRIVLFGSCAKGTDTRDSDIDVFIVADQDCIEQIRHCISEYKIDRDIKPVIIDSIELIDMEENDKIFMAEIDKGIIIWDGNDE